MTRQSTLEKKIHKLEERNADLEAKLLGFAAGVDRLLHRHSKPLPGMLLTQSTILDSMLNELTRHLAPRLPVAEIPLDMDAPGPTTRIDAYVRFKARIECEETARQIIAERN